MHGLVIGKFYPPHRGHKYLIDQAAAQADTLTVIVCAKKAQNIPGELRAKWLREIHPQADVRLLNQDTFDDTDPKAWTKAVLDLLGGQPDLFFTSEAYGEEYAALLGAKHIAVDRYRTRFPISGSEIRENPAAFQDFLEPCVRDYFLAKPSHA